MSKIKTYKGQLPIGEQEKIHLSTNDGLTGYRIRDFKIVISDTSTATYALVAQVFLTDQTGKITATIDFSKSDLIAAIFQDSQQSYFNKEVVILDKETFNQDIFITMDDATSATTPGNYYLELETMDLSDIETTKLTLQCIRTVTSR